MIGYRVGSPLASATEQPLSRIDGPRDKVETIKTYLICNDEKQTLCGDNKDLIIAVNRSTN